MSMLYMGYFSDNTTRSNLTAPGGQLGKEHQMVKSHIPEGKEK